MSSSTASTGSTWRYRAPGLAVLVASPALLRVHCRTVGQMRLASACAGSWRRRRERHPPAGDNLSRARVPSSPPGSSRRWPRLPGGVAGWPSVTWVPPPSPAAGATQPTTTSPRPRRSTSAATGPGRRRRGDGRSTGKRRRRIVRLGADGRAARRSRARRRHWLRSTPVPHGDRAAARAPRGRARRRRARLTSGLDKEPFRLTGRRLDAGRGRHRILQRRRQRGFTSTTRRRRWHAGHRPPVA